MSNGCTCLYTGAIFSGTDDCPWFGAGTPDERQLVCPGDGGTASDASVD